MSMLHLNWELIGIIIGMVATILGGVWFVVNKAFGVGKFTHKVDEIDKRTGSAACEAHSKDIDDIKSELKSVNENLTKVTSLLSIKYKNAAPMFAIKNSPRRLNEMGQRVLDEVKGMDFLQTNKDFFFAQMDASSPKTAYDVENAAHTVCLVSTDNEIFNGIKNFVYNSPSYTIKDEDGKECMYDLSLPDVCFVLSIPLRDMYLEAHPEILSE